MALIHLYFAPSVQLPGSKRSPIRQRRKVGIVYAMYRPTVDSVVTARNATGVPSLFGKYAGTVTIMANEVTNSTAQVGVRLLLSRRHSRCPGIAPSRENANDIRDALV